MKPSPKLTAELVRLVTTGSKPARIAITGASMEPSLRAGMVVDVEPIAAKPRIGDILVFQSQRTLIAHRLIGFDLRRRSERRAPGKEPRFKEQIECYITSGDAQPEKFERVPPHLVVGRVSAVWASAEAGAKLIDDMRFDLLGLSLARTRGLRARIAKLRMYGRQLVTLLSSDLAKAVPKPVFATLVTATHAFERGDFARGVALLEAPAPADLLEVARRHHMSGCFSNWFDEAAHAGVRVPQDLEATFRRMRWANALQTGRVLACLHGVRDVFRAAGIPHIFLKGSGRLAARDSGADVQFSADVDVMVPPDETDAASAALRAAGYTSVPNEYRRSHDDSWHHHCEALVSPAVAVPVEVHYALAAPALVSQRLDYAALRPFARCVTTGSAEADVFDDVGSAIVLAYHARDLHVWRDVVLLSRLLRTFDATTRRRFDLYMKAERTDGLRLASAVAAAEAITADDAKQTRAITRYLKWAALREDLPRPAYCDIIESVIGRCPMPNLHLHLPATPARWLRCWIRNVISLPSIARFAFDNPSGRRVDDEGRLYAAVRSSQHG